MSENSIVRGRFPGKDGIAQPPGPPHDGMMDGIADLQKRVDHLETRFDGLSGQIRSDRNAVIGTIVASVLAAVALLYAAQSNMLSAFQAGLSAIQATSQGALPAPIVIQMPPTAQPPQGTPRPAPQP